MNDQQPADDELTPTPPTGASDADAAPEPAPEPEPEFPPEPAPPTPVAPAEWEAVDAANRAEAERRIGITSVVARSLDLLIAHPLPFVALHLPSLLVGLLGSLVYATPANLTRSPDPIPIFAVVIVAIVLSQIIGLATMILADDLRAGRPEALGSVIRRALGRTPAAIGFILLLYAILFGLLIVVAIPLAIAAAMRLAWFFVIAAVAFIVSFAYVAVRWSLATPAIGLEGAGPVDALGRSQALTRRNAWRLVGAFVLLVLLIGPLSFGLSMLALLTDSALLRIVVPGLVGLFTGPLASIVLATIFGDLSGRPIASDPSRRDPKPRRQIVVGATLLAGVIALAITVPNIGAVVSRYAFQGVSAADRGIILFGTARNPVDACRPGSVKSTFSTSEEIFVGGYFTAPILPGQTATVEIYRDGDLLNSGPLSAARPVVCYYEINGLRGALPGTYRLLVRIGNQILAEGTFVVQ